MIHVAVLLTVFNRREKTLSCLERLFSQDRPSVRLTVHLLDDGSTDETSSAVHERFPEVVVLQGDGGCYWNGGMRRAWEDAVELQPDFFLWLNDDTELDADALTKLLRTSAFFADQAIVVGSTRDAQTGGLTYGGVVRPYPLKPLYFERVTPSDRPGSAETMNGNCVLIPGAVAKAVGNLSHEFSHGMGDFDYGLRARQEGFEIWVAPGFVGTCSRNQEAGTWQDRTLPRRVRWQKIRSIKGLPPREWIQFARRHAGLFWPLHWVAPYARVLVSPQRRTK